MSLLQILSLIPCNPFSSSRRNSSKLGKSINNPVWLYCRSEPSNNSLPNDTMSPYKTILMLIFKERPICLLSFYYLLVRGNSSIVVFRGIFRACKYVQGFLMAFICSLEPVDNYLEIKYRIGNGIRKSNKCVLLAFSSE